jgi:DNA-binding beta-propeller fold protein YncE
MRRFAIFVASALVAGALIVQGGCSAEPVETPAAQFETKADEVPVYEWDPYWPQLPLPNDWAIGNVAGLDVDSEDHVWILNRPRSVLAGHEDDAAYTIPESQCCVPPPAIIEFDADGKVVRGFGGPGPEYQWGGSSTNAASSASSTNQGSPQGVPQGYDPTYLASAPTPPTVNLTPRSFHWPRGEHSLTVDHQGNVWTGGSHVLKFARDGTFLMEIGYDPTGKAGRDSHNTKILGGGSNVAGVAVDRETNEVFVADGYGNRRVIVFDADTGAFKRYWGAYGEPPDDTVPPRRLPFEWKPTDPAPTQFAVAHSVRIDQDGLVYVGDRNNSRIQVFQKDGTFVKEAFIRPTTMRGTVLDLNFSKDPGQLWIFVADGRNDKVWILRRSDLQVIGEFGHGGQFGGQFTIAHAIAADSKNNVYVGESLSGNRVQRFLYKGTRPQTTQYDRNGMAID